MCLICSITNAPVCGTGVCQATFWQQNVNLLIMTLTPIIGGITLWIKKLIQKLKKK